MVAVFKDCPSETDVDLKTLCWPVRLPEDSILTARLAISRASAGPSVLTTKPWGLPGVGVWGSEQGEREAEEDQAKQGGIAEPF